MQDTPDPVRETPESDDARKRAAVDFTYYADYLGYAGDLGYEGRLKPAVRAAGERPAEDDPTGDEAAPGV